MTPISFLFLTILVTLIGYTLQWTGEVIHRRKLRALAQAWELHFSPRDQFNLVRHVAAQLPALGPANVQVVDIIYGLEASSHRYYLTAEYTTGVLRSKKRRQQVCTFREAKVPAGEFSPLVFADPKEPLVDQYQDLHERTTRSVQPTFPNEAAR